jgi:hypothetical protein
MKMKRPMGDLLAQLKTQIEFLTRSAQSFDAGEKNEAVRMAVGIRVIVHDTKESKSLLRQLGKKDILFYDTAHPFDSKNLMPHLGLIQMRLGGPGTGFRAGLDDIPPERLGKKIQFNTWWDRIVLSDHLKNRFTRKDLVLTLANQEGGAHVDPHLEEKYVKLSRFNSTGWRFGEKGVERPAERPDFPSLRQITHEVLKTLKDAFPQLFS